MKGLFHEYGTGLLTAGIALLLFVLLFTRMTAGGNAGLLSVLSTGAKIEGKNYAGYEDSKASQDIAAGSLPQIAYTGEVIRVGEKVDLERLFTAKNGLGSEIEYEIMDLRDMQDNILAFENSKKEFCFPRQGIYKIRLEARDKEGGITRNVFSLPVTHSKGGGR